MTLQKLDYLMMTITSVEGVASLTSRNSAVQQVKVVLNLSERLVTSDIVADLMSSFHNFEIDPKALSLKSAGCRFADVSLIDFLGGGKESLELGNQAR